MEGNKSSYNEIPNVLYLNKKENGCAHGDLQHNIISCIHRVGGAGNMTNKILEIYAPGWLLSCAFMKLQATEETCIFLHFLMQPWRPVNPPNFY